MSSKAEREQCGKLSKTLAGVSGTWFVWHLMGVEETAGEKQQRGVKAPNLNNSSKQNTVDLDNLCPTWVARIPSPEGQDTVAKQLRSASKPQIGGKTIELIPAYQGLVGCSHPADYVLQDLEGHCLLDESDQRG